MAAGAEGQEPLLQHGLVVIRSWLGANDRQADDLTNLDPVRYHRSRTPRHEG